MPIVVGIPTYRRPELLRGLLLEVTKQAEGHPVSVVVADNDCDPAVERVAEEVGRGTTVPITVRPVRERGISQARNALVMTAYEVDPEWVYLVMYDDDGLPEPGALMALVDCARRYDADCASGPVDMGINKSYPTLVRSYLLASSVLRREGLVSSLDGGQNLLLSRRLVDRMPRPWFAPHRGLSGGEDVAFFLRARSLGARFAWSPAAVVNEPLPPHRLSNRGALLRAFEENAANADTEVEFFGYGHTLATLGRSLVWPFVNVAGAVHHRDPERLAGVAVSLCGVAGRAAGLAGHRPRPYL